MDEARAGVLRLYESDELGLSFAPELGWHPVRHLLGITAFGMNASLAGRGGEALTHLRRFVDLDPKYAGYAAADADRDAIRGEPGFPAPPA